MRTMWVYVLNGAVQHIGNNTNFSIVAQAEVGSSRSLGRHRGWPGLRLLSSAGSAFKTDLNFQNEAGGQFPGLRVFGRFADGPPGQFYSSAMEPRIIDLLSPVWHLLDLPPKGRGDWLPSLAYD